MSEDTRPLVELDLRGASKDAKSLAFASTLLEAWGEEPRPFRFIICASEALAVQQSAAILQDQDRGSARPDVILAFWPVWPLTPPAPVVLYIGHGAGVIPAWYPRRWFARRCSMVLVPTRREKVELQTMRRFRRDRVWAIDSQDGIRTVENALSWIAAGSKYPPTKANHEIKDPAQAI